MLLHGGWLVLFVEMKIIISVCLNGFLVNFRIYYVLYGFICYCYHFACLVRLGYYRRKYCWFEMPYHCYERHSQCTNLASTSFILLHQSMYLLEGTQSRVVYWSQYICLSITSMASCLFSGVIQSRDNCIWAWFCSLNQFSLLIRAVCKGATFSGN